MKLGNNDIKQLLDMIKNPEEYFGKTKYSGVYRAVAEDVEDPEQRGRVRVRVNNIHSADAPIKNLPWAEGNFADGGGDDYGDFHVPYTQGDTVWVMFEEGDSQFPVWMGTWYGMPNDKTEVPKEATNSYPLRRVIKSRYGHRIEISDDDENLEIVIRTGKYQDADYPEAKSPTLNGHDVDTDQKVIEGRRITIRDSDEFGIEIATEKGHIKMDDGNNLMEVFWTGDYKEHIRGNRLRFVEGEDKTIIIGDVVTEIEGDQTTKVNGNSLVEVDGNSDHNVGGDYELDTAGTVDLGAGGDLDIDTGANLGISAQGNQVRTAGTTIKDSAPAGVEHTP